MSENLYALFVERMPVDTSQPLIETEDGTIIPYADLPGRTAAIAGALAGMGVGRGDRVAVQVPKSAEALFLYLACLRMGAIFLPLNTAYPPAEVAYFLGDAAPRVLVCAPASAAVLGPVAESAGVAHVVTLGEDGDGTLTEAAAAATPFETVVEVEADEIAAILYTSGTTGRSKGAMLSHRNLSSNALTLHKAWGWVSGDVLLHTLPIFHVHGLFVATHCALLNGSTMLFHARFDPDAIVGLLPRSTVFMGVPTYYTRLLAHDGFTRDACANMRLFVSGSAPLLVDTFAEFRERTGHTILERYGMTEAGMICSNPYDGDRIPGKVGPPLPGIEARVADEDGQVLTGAGEIGVLEIKGPNVFQGYWRMPEKTASEFRDDGWFVTGDMATIDAAGYVAIVGRSKDLIISGGLNIYPKEIESHIDDVEGVLESAVIGLPHPDFGEAVAAVVVGKAEGTLDETSVVAALRGQLASFKLPKRIFIVDDLPRNTMGKVQKNVLRDRYKGLFED